MLTTSPPVEAKGNPVAMTAKDYAALYRKAINGTP
jgi:hypothetical protein